LSDHFDMLVVSDVTVADAEQVSRRVIAGFLEQGLIAGHATPDCTLGKAGYRPGPAVTRLEVYKPESGDDQFWNLLTCGLEPRIGRGFNDLALGSVCEGMGCPTCGAVFEPGAHDEFYKALIRAIDQWFADAADIDVRCPVCRHDTPVTGWQSTPPLGFGNLSFRFWNWTPLKSLCWKVDIIALARQISGHAIIHTYGHL
jgi:hypothetical protein